MVNFNKTLLLLGCLSFFLAVTASAQQYEQTRTYRVVAYKNGQPAITSMSNTTEVVPYLSIYIPNSFTPNGDGINDTFGITGEAIKDFTMEVYNRWGQVIFQSKSYNDRWDGTFDGVKAPQGTYVYRVTAMGITGKRTTKDGSVNVIY